MNKKEMFADPNSQRIWDNYFKRVQNVIRVTDSDTQEEIKFEIQDHLYQSFTEIDAENEVSKLLQAIDRLGEPEEFLMHVVSEKLLIKGTRNLSPSSLILGLFYGMWGGIRQVLTGLVFGIGYIFTFVMGVLSFAKLFIPEKLGLFIWPDGSWMFGLTGDPSGSEEILGYWLIPLSLAITFILYYTLTLGIRMMLKKE